MGTHAGRRAADGCLAGLETDDRVTARGRVPRDVGPGARGPARTVRLDLEDVELRRAGRACRVPRLVVRIRPPGRALEAGGVVAVSGRWWAYDPRAGPVRPLSGYGMVRGRLSGDGGGPRKGAGTATGGGRPGADHGGPGLRLRIRAAAARRLGEAIPADAGPLARALVLADRSDLEPGLSRRFADAGLAHLLAISGLHVGILAGGALWLVGLAVRRPARYLVAAGAVTAYVVVIGAPAAATRAAVIFAGWAVARSRGAPIRVTELLGAAAVVSLLADPLAVRGAGFQLSFAGFGGLVLGDALAVRGLDALPAGPSRPGRRLRRALRALGAGTGAFAATAPFAALHFQHAAPVAVLSNFAGVPLVTLALAGTAGALLLPGPLAALAGDGAGTALRGLVEVVEAVSALPVGHGAATPPGPVSWAAAGLVLAAAAHLARGGSPARAALPAGAAAALWVGGPVLLAAGQAGTLVCQLDVGQGDAAVIRSRGGRWLVLDAGPRSRVRDAGRSVVSPFLRDRGAGAVALLVLTHPDLDHVGGTDAVLAEFRVERVLDAAAPVAREAYVRFLDGVAEEGAAWIPARAGARLRVDEVEVTVLGAAGPGRGGTPGAGTGDPPSRGAGDANDAGVSVRVRVGSRVVYVNTGDASISRERAILERWPPDSLHTILLKVGHHGSRTSTAPEWLAATRPAVAVVSAGAGNRYGHPHPGTLRRLRAAGVPRIWRTDRDGSLCLHVRRDGHWRIRGEDGWRPPPGPGGARRRAPAHDTIPGGPRWRDRWSR